VFVPFYLMKVDHFSFARLADAAGAKGVSLSLVPNKTWWEPFKILNVVLGWGLGYFGLPHIITKFMGIKKVSDMRKAQIVGMTWQAITMAAVIWIGFLGIAYFSNGLNNPELVFIDMVKGTFHPLLSGFILCAIFAATISTMDSQILVLASTLSEDFYHRLINKRATSEQIVKASRISIFLVSAIAYVIAFFKIDTIYKLVEYAWSGLGSSFGPVLLFALYSKKTSKGAAWAGIIVGGGISAFWPLIDKYLQTGILPIIPGFFLSTLAIWIGNEYSHHKRRQH
ncbi:MAG: sodium/proline symporter, partial [Simkaniaceae bacterium]|nr:sodium/proline symporter [Simkaniaceae bacterium]